MQRWEFAELGYDNTGGYHFLIIFKVSRTQVINLIRDESQGDKTHADARRRTMAQLGLQGWELMTGYSSSPNAETLYFKRPVS